MNAKRRRLNEYEPHGTCRKRIDIYMTVEEKQIAERKAKELGWSVSRWVVHETIYRHQTRWHIRVDAHTALKPLAEKIASLAKQLNVEVHEAHILRYISKDFEQETLRQLNHLLRKTGKLIDDITTLKYGETANYETHPHTIQALILIEDSLLGCARNIDQLPRYLEIEQRGYYRRCAASCRSISDLTETWLERLEQQTNSQKEIMS